MSADAWSQERPAAGLVCYQPRRGYRYGVESYALASFALGGGPTRTAVDLGAGSGIVSLLLAHVGVAVLAVERDARWKGWLERSIAESGADVRVCWGDARAVPLPSVDVVVANPPWYDPAAGPISPDDHKAHARSALHGDARAFAEAGLRAAPRVCLVLPASVGLPDVPAAFYARRARVGGLVLGELRAGEGTPTDVEVDPYAPFR